MALKHNTRSVLKAKLKLENGGEDEDDRKSVALHSYRKELSLNDVKVYNRRNPFPVFLAWHSYSRSPFGEKDFENTIKKGNAQLFPCPSCHIIFKSKPALLKHDHIHKDKKEGCSFCSKIFPNPKDLHLHVFKHYPPRPYICGRCDLDYKTLIRLQGHFKKKHLDEIFKCPVKDCKKTYRVLQNCGKHMIIKH